MKKVYRRELLPLLARKLKARTYVEIGVKGGRTFLPIPARRKIAIDPVFRIPVRTRRLASLNPFRRCMFFEMPSDDFFAGPASDVFRRERISLAFIDGLHTWEQSLKDLDNVVEWLAPGGLIVMHDCSPPNELAATRAQGMAEAKKINPPDWNGRWCGDVWKTVLTIRAARPNLDISVIDRDSGLGIIRVLPQGETREMLSLSEQQIADMSYAELDADRDRLLNVRTPDRILASL